MTETGKLNDGDVVDVDAKLVLEDSTDPDILYCRVQLSDGRGWVTQHMQRKTLKTKKVYMESVNPFEVSSDASSMLIFRFLDSLFTVRYGSN